MGLSRRRRALKSGAASSKQAKNYDDEANNGGRDTCQTAKGSTFRRLKKVFLQHQKACEVGFEVYPNRYLYRPRQRCAYSAIGFMPNENHLHKEKALVADNLYDCRVQYSLKKKSRWQIQEQLAELSADGSLQDRNLFVFNDEWRAKGRGYTVTRQMVTNADYMRLAATELRARTSGSSRHRPDKANFSGRVEQAQVNRPLVRFGRHGQLNKHSLLREFEIPVSEFADAETLRVESCKQQMLHVSIQQPRGKVTGKTAQTALVENIRIGQRLQRRPNCHEELLREDDFCDFVSAECETDEESDAEESSAERHPSSVLTLFDAMSIKTRSKSAPSENLAMTLKAESRESAEQEEWVFVSEDEENAKNDQVNDAMSSDVDSVLDQRRPTLNIKPRLVETERLEQLFAGTGALFMSISRPRKFAVVLQDNLAESVSFEVLSENNGMVKLAMRHLFINDDADPTCRRLTSTAKLEATPDPFKYLRGLVTAVTASPHGLVVLQPQCGELPVGWCRTELWNETDARRAALRTLPMFVDPAVKASKKVSAERLDDTHVECGICNNLMRTSAAVEFPRRSTELGVCGHRFCNACWVRHVASCLKAGSTRVECPANGCATVLDAAVLLWFCPQRLLPALVGAAFRAWQRSLPTSRFCPLPRCGRLLVAADDSGKNALCSCWTSFCLACGQEPHWPVDCETAEQYLTVLTATEKRPKREHRTRYFKTTVTGRICPGCKALVERLCGCDHMTCFCKQVFCWKCGNPKNVRAIHSCGRHASSLVQKSFSGRERVLKLPSSLSLHGKTRRARESVGRRLLESQARMAARLLSAAGRFVGNSDQTVAYALMSSYLLEYTCVLLDANEAGEKLQSMVHRIGETIQQALRSVHAEFQLGWSAVIGSGDAGRAGRICDKLDSLQRQLAVECERLRKIVDTFEEQNDEALDNASSQV